MKIMTTYKTKIRDSHSALANTVGWSYVKFEYKLN